MIYGGAMQIKIDVNSFGSFAELLDAIIMNRGFKSDEQLARRAMFKQPRDLPRINIQRRTINNWRNGKSLPRSSSDRQYELVVSALEMSAIEVSALTNFINAHTKQMHKKTLTFDNIYIVLSSKVFMSIGLLTLMLLVGATNYFQSQIQFNSTNSSHYSDIPVQYLRLSKDGFVLPKTSNTAITNEDLLELSNWELYVARNEIFARRGWSFVQKSSICLQNHFNGFSWSKNQPSGWYYKKVTPDKLTKIDRKNANTIKHYECSERGGQYRCNGNLNSCN